MPAKLSDLPLLPSGSPTDMLYTEVGGVAYRAPMSTEAGGVAPGLVAAGASKSITKNVGFQAADPTKAAFLSINITSTATITLLVGTTNTCSVILGASKAGVEAGTGNPVGRYSNSQTGALVVGANLSTVYTNTYYVFLPAGAWCCVRETAGTITIVDAVEQVFG